MINLPKDFDEFIAKAIKTFPNLHPNYREQDITAYRKKIHDERFDKLDWSLRQHQNSTVSKGSLMVRIAAMKLEGVSSEEIRRTLLEDCQAQAIGSNERYKNVDIYMPRTPVMVTNMVNSAMKSVDTPYLEAFKLDSELSKEYLRKWLKKDTVTVYRGIQGEPAKAMASKAQGENQSITISGNSLASFTTREGYAAQFNGVIIEKKIPISRISYAFDWREGNIPSPKSGRGESEVLLPSKVINPLAIRDIQVNEEKLGITFKPTKPYPSKIAISGQMVKQNRRGGAILTRSGKLIRQKRGTIIT